MPELPEVETMRRGILGIVGSRIEDVERVACRRRPIAIAPRIDQFRRRAVGRVIRDVGRVGKRVVVHLDSRRRDRARTADDGPGARCRAAEPRAFAVSLHACRATASRELLYWDRRGLGSVRLFSPKEFETAFGPQKVGPDALAMTAELFRERLGGSKRAVKVALLDQRAVAGIGNLYASEILHLAGVHPAQACDKITRAPMAGDRRRHARRLEAAIRYEGSTLGDGTYRNALNQEGGYQNHHRVYDRAGEACPRCGARQRRLCASCRPSGRRFFVPGVSEKVAGIRSCAQRMLATLRNFAIRGEVSL